MTDDYLGKFKCLYTFGCPYSPCLRGVRKSGGSHGGLVFKSTCLLGILVVCITCFPFTHPVTGVDVRAPSCLCLSGLEDMTRKWTTHHRPRFDSWSRYHAGYLWHSLCPSHLVESLCILCMWCLQSLLSSWSIATVLVQVAFPPWG